MNNVYTCIIMLVWYMLCIARCCRYFCLAKRAASGLNKGEFRPRSRLLLIHHMYVYIYIYIYMYIHTCWFGPFCLVLVIVVYSHFIPRAGSTRARSGRIAYVLLLVSCGVCVCVVCCCDCLCCVVLVLLKLVAA